MDHVVASPHLTSRILFPSSHWKVSFDVTNLVSVFVKGLDASYSFVLKVLSLNMIEFNGIQEKVSLLLFLFLPIILFFRFCVFFVLVNGSLLLFMLCTVYVGKKNRSTKCTGWAILVALPRLFFNGIATRKPNHFCTFV